MKERDRKKDIKQAKIELENRAKRVSGLFQLWHIFSSAKVMCDAFKRDLKQLSYEACMAFTKAIVVEYSKPWSNNNSKLLKAIRDGRKYTFLEPIINKTPVHDELIELRDKMIAHIDKGYESHGLTLRGKTVINNRSNSLGQEGTLGEVFFPISIRIEATGPIWWLNSKDKIGEIQSHIQNCVSMIEGQIIVEATELRNLSYDHIHVLKHIPEIFKIEEFDSNMKENGNLEIRYVSGATSVPNFTLGPSKPIKLGKTNIQGTVGAFEPAPRLPSNIEIEGKGYRLKFKAIDDTGKVDFDITFPRYPYPKIKPKKN